MSIENVEVSNGQARKSQSLTPRTYWKRVQAFVTSTTSPTLSSPSSQSTPLGTNGGGEGQRPILPRSRMARRSQHRKTFLGVAPSTPARPIKIKIVSWNMHDSLPKGNVEEILGNVPPYVPKANCSTNGLPQFEEGPEHPYHLVVIGGQECPTVSGIPMGLAGFKLKDREREDRKSKSSHHILHSQLSHRSPHRKDSRPTKSVSPTRSPHKHPNRSQSTATPTPTSGWSYILEDWYCRGAGNVKGARPILSTEKSEKEKDKEKEKENDSSVLTSANWSFESGHQSQSQTPPQGQSEFRPIDLTWDTAEQGSPTLLSNHPDGVKEERGNEVLATQGPYQLLAKERLMGIYLAIFVHRDAAQFVEGISKDTVATGMMRGRIGNKGCAGVSLKIAGTTMLFVNAHLAAHEDHVSERLANFDRIKSELVVDSFLPAKDPRQLKEDITDRFDHTFFFGDLNFRLKISRLHADWLIARDEYPQALKFDQLREIIESKQSFIGFNESEINFPPTYKFDVLKTLKKSKSKKRISFKEKARNLYEEGKDIMLGGGDEEEHARHGHVQREEKGEGKERCIYSQGNSSAISSVNPDQSGEREREGSEAGIMEHASTTSSYVAKEVLHDGHVGSRNERKRSSLLKNLSPMKTKAGEFLKKRLRGGAINQITQARFTPPDSNNEVKGGQKNLESEEPLALPLPPFEPAIIAPTPETEKSFPLSPTNLESSSLKERLHAPQAPELIPHSYSTGNLLTPSRVNSLPPSPPIGSNTPSEVGVIREPVSKGNGVAVTNATGSEVDILGRAQSGKSDGGVYDSSSKQRVPSWCDRILWKTTIVPKLHNSNGRRRPSLRLWSPNPLTAIRRSASLTRTNTSTSQTAAAAAANEGDVTAVPSKLVPTPAQAQMTSSSQCRAGSSHGHEANGLGVAGLLAIFFPRANSQSVDKRTKTIDIPPSTNNLNEVANGPKSGRQNSGSSATEGQSRSESGPGVVQSQSESANQNTNTNLNTSAVLAMRWLFGLLPNREPTRSPTSPSGEKDAPSAPPPVIHHKGEVICLHYGTLDDAAMRRLEGRSDHRPILGTYSVYI